jgi:hypothetical protein
MTAFAITRELPPPSFRMNSPNKLLRFFTQEDHARSFMAGKVRFGLLEYYKTIEDLRQDETEGVAAFSWRTRPTPVHYTGSSVNAHFILSTVHPEADRSVLTRRFGRYIVRINDPVALLERINAVWRAHPWASGHCAIKPVVYNKGESLEPTPSLIPPWEYSYCQKPRKDFVMEREFRYVLTCTGGDRALKDHLWLPLPCCSDICDTDF